MVLVNEIKYYNDHIFIYNVNMINLISMPSQNEIIINFEMIIAELSGEAGV